VKLPDVYLRPPLDGKRVPGEVELEMDMDENDQFMGTRLEEQMLHVAEKHVDMLIAEGLSRINWLKLGTAVQ
jgi:hypothetical protein